MKFNRHSVKEGLWVLAATGMLVCFVAIVQMDVGNDVVSPKPTSEISQKLDDIDLMLNNITDKYVVRSYCRKADMISKLAEQKRIHTRNLMVPHYKNMAQRMLAKVEPLLETVQKEMDQDINHLKSRGYRLPTEYECDHIKEA